MEKMTLEEREKYYSKNDLKKILGKKQVKKFDYLFDNNRKPLILKEELEKIIPIQTLKIEKEKKLKTEKKPKLSLKHSKQDYSWIFKNSSKNHFNVNGDIVYSDIQNHPQLIIPFFRWKKDREFFYTKTDLLKKGWTEKKISLYFPHGPTELRIQTQFKNKVKLYCKKIVDNQFD